MSLSAGRPSRASKPSTLSDMADTKPTVRVNFDLARDDHIKLKVYAAQQGKTVRQVLVDIISKII